MILRDGADAGTKSNFVCGSWRGKDMNHVLEAKKDVVNPLSQTDRGAGNGHYPGIGSSLQRDTPDLERGAILMVHLFIHLFTPPFI